MRFTVFAWMICACTHQPTALEASASSAVADASPPDMSDSQLTALSKTARFGLRFEAPPPEGVFYTLVFSADGATEDACHAYSTGIDGDAELIEVHLGDVAPGTYPIADEAELTAASRTPIATARVIQFTDGEHRSFPVSTGQIEVMDAPLASNPTEGQLRGRLSIEVPHRLWGAPVCRTASRQLPDGGMEVMNFGCECTARDGTVANCADIPEDVEAIPLVVDFEATHCKEMCRWSQALTENYCEDY